MVLTKFESKSARVKGLAFHSVRPWLLASLHTGCIQLWDYRVGALLDRFEEHDGPVRGVDFHAHQPLFVSGGDDYRIRVWSHGGRDRRCLFSLNGHLDYVRTVFFHARQPWVLSASDDQTVRVWNWQSRACVCVLTGHNHYVMCAQFHPTDDALVISASLDQTVRVWDLTGLRTKTAPEAVVRFVLEGHERGVNWASFHPTLPFAVSAADDRFVKIWRLSDSRAFEVDCLRGHFNNISCVLVAAPGDVVVSNGEDRCLKLWSFAKRTCIQTVRRETDRFWVLARHPSLNLLAAGHDSGFFVFKIARERPAFAAGDDALVYVKENTIRRLVFGVSKDTAVRSIPSGGVPFSLSLNHTLKSAILVFRSGKDDDESAQYQIVSMETADTTPQTTLHRCRAALWLSKSRFAVLTTRNTLEIMTNASSSPPQKTIKLPTAAAAPKREMFPASTSHVLVTDGASNSVHLVDCNSGTVAASLKLRKRVKHAFWAPSGRRVAIVSKNQIVLTEQRLAPVLCECEDMCRVKSGAWASDDLFLYTTANHVKYLLTSGDRGIVRTVDLPLYLTRAVTNGGGGGGETTLFCLDRNIVPRVLVVDLTECNLKLALVNRQYDKVRNILAKNSLQGQAIIAYLTKKQYPELAMQFVTDKNTRFALALQSGDLNQAVDIAVDLGSRHAHWLKLTQVACERMALNVLEQALQRLKAVHKLAFMYTLTGQSDKVNKMLKVANVTNDTCSQFHLTLVVGDLRARINLLRNSGATIALAYTLAKTHRIDELANEIAEEIRERGDVVPNTDEGEGRPQQQQPIVPLLHTNSFACEIPSSQ